MISCRRWYGSWLASRMHEGRIEEQVFHSEARALLWIALAAALAGCTATPLVDVEVPHADAIAAVCRAICAQAERCDDTAKFGPDGCEAWCLPALSGAPSPAPVTKARVDGCVAAIEASGCDGAKATAACEGVR